MRTRAQLELDARMRRVTDVARRLPAMTARNGRAERERLRADYAAGRRLQPRWERAPEGVPRHVRHALDEARALAPEVPAGELYLARLDELELELELIDALGDAKRVRPLAARRFGTGREAVPIGARRLPLAEIAERLLEEVAGPPEEPTLPAEGEPSLASIVRAFAAAAGLDVEVRVEPGLVANAAAGERTVFLADRRFGRREALRLGVHEVLGHLVAAANGRSQPLALLSVGTAGSVADQEGLAILLEEQAGLLDGRRVRTFAARVWVTDRVHAGAPFDEVVHLLVGELGFTGDEAIALAERGFRGGGVARDAVYLRGWLRVRRAVAEGVADVEALRQGRVSLDALPQLRRLREV
ncbi:MAG TPA: DUF1704 domain-containing protein, partial [Polyangiaceae bacterium LLY-WYZ-15_(1-7)]|nr:DUF1704 domain-containing protein [Polyangiaceae bacterium LLY-WYZ-15_(1-7)]